MNSFLCILLKSSKLRRCIFYLLIVLIVILVIMSFQKENNLFIHSAYYYPNSESLGKNAVAILMTMHRTTAESLSENFIKLIGTDDNINILESGIRFEIEPFDQTNSEYVTALGISNSIKNLKVLQLETNGKSMVIPLKPLKTEISSPVVFCTSPLITLDNWRKIVLQLHISKRFHAHVHVYISKVISSFHRLLKEYSRHGFVSIDIWPDVDFAPDETLVNFEIRNKKSAHTDCLLQYKESAKFIVFQDFDDIFIPKATSYFEDFLSGFSDGDNTRLFYPKRNFQLMMNDEISTSRLIESTNNHKTGNTVIRPKHHNVTWARYAENNTDFGRIAPQERIFYRITEIEPIEQKDSIPINDLVEEHILLEIDKEVRQLHATLPFKKLISSIPSTNHYMVVMRECYRKIYYSNDTSNFDISIDCIRNNVLQKGDPECMRSTAKYSVNSLELFKIHYSSYSFMTRNIYCF